MACYHDWADKSEKLTHANFFEEFNTVDDIDKGGKGFDELQEFEIKKLKVQCDRDNADK